MKKFPKGGQLIWKVRSNSYADEGQKELTLALFFQSRKESSKEKDLRVIDMLDLRIWRSPLSILWVIEGKTVLEIFMYCLRCVVFN